jgi:hypothetical protein
MTYYFFNITIRIENLSSTLLKVLRVTSSLLRLRGTVLDRNKFASNCIKCIKIRHIMTHWHILRTPTYYNKSPLPSRLQILAWFVLELLHSQTIQPQTIGPLYTNFHSQKLLFKNRLGNKLGWVRTNALDLSVDRVLSPGLIISYVVRLLQRQNWFKVFGAVQWGWLVCEPRMWGHKDCPLQVPFLSSAARELRKETASEWRRICRWGR